jgi:hypothetical protein
MESKKWFDKNVYNLVQEYERNKEDRVFFDTDYNIMKGKLARMQYFANRQKKNYNASSESYIQTRKFLESKGFMNVIDNYFCKYIERKGYKLNITFKVINPILSMSCASDVQYCNCHTSCCGKEYQNFIIEEATFDEEINKIIKLQEE